MVIKSFPPIEYSDQHGLLAIGGDAEADSLLLAYRSGIFPWEGEPLMWFAPQKRAVLFLTDFRISRSFSRALRDSKFEIRFNTNFRSVMLACAKAENRKGAHGTWLTSALIEGYCELFERGNAYSVEAYLNCKLVGGVYGVLIGGMVSAESMFYLEPDASKVCLLKLIDQLKSQGIDWVDCQAINPFTKSFGVKEIPRERFMKMLKIALEKTIPCEMPRTTDPIT